MTFGWERYADESIGIDRFGASAPGNVVMDKLGINVGQRGGSRHSAGPGKGVIMDRLSHLYHEFGQSPWLDNLKRGYITSGQLGHLVDEGIRGLTSNPTIFQKAIQGSPDYDEQFRTLAAVDRPIIDDYWAIVLADIHGALDVFAALYHDSHGADGYVSVEVDPGLAHDGPATEAAAATCTSGSTAPT